MSEGEEYEPSGAFEAIKVLGRELQLSKERSKQLEVALNDVRSLIYFCRSMSSLTLTAMATSS